MSSLSPYCCQFRRGQCIVVGTYHFGMLRGAARAPGFTAVVVEAYQRICPTARDAGGARVARRVACLVAAATGIFRLCMSMGTRDGDSARYGNDRLGWSARYYAHVNRYCDRDCTFLPLHGSYFTWDLHLHYKDDSEVSQRGPSSLQGRIYPLLADLTRQYPSNSRFLRICSPFNLRPSASFKERVEGRTLFLKAYMNST